MAVGCGKLCSEAGEGGGLFTVRSNLGQHRALGPGTNCRTRAATARGASPEIGTTAEVQPVRALAPGEAVQ